MNLDYKRHAFGAVVIGATGLLTSLCLRMVLSEGGSGFLPELVFTFPLAAFIGAAIAGSVCAKMFGHGGISGWAFAYVGGSLATVIGAALAGEILITSFAGPNLTATLGGVYAVVFLADSFVAYSSLLAAWIVMISISHQAFVLLTSFRRF